MFAEKRPIVGDYLLMQGEKDPNNEIYLFVDGHSGSIAGYLHQIGWNQRYIMFTDENWPKPWNIITVENHKLVTIAEAQRLADADLKNIQIFSPADAWKKAKH
jgi:hypothetical protein